MTNAPLPGTRVVLRASLPHNDVSGNHLLAIRLGVYDFAPPAVFLDTEILGVGVAAVRCLSTGLVVRITTEH